jgi:hypothetical protein
VLLHAAKNSTPRNDAIAYSPHDRSQPVASRMRTRRLSTSTGPVWWSPQESTASKKPIVEGRRHRRPLRDEARPPNAVGDGSDLWVTFPNTGAADGLRT